MERRELFREGMLAVTFVALTAALPAVAAEPKVEVSGEWQVTVTLDGKRPKVLHIERPQLIAVSDERYASLPVFNPNTGGWVKGAQLVGVRAQETTTPFLLDPASLIVRAPAGPNGEAAVYERGRDYEVDLDWGTFGRLEGGHIQADTPVAVQYRYSPLRLDTIYRTRDGKVEIMKGTGKSAAPLPPDLPKGAKAIANIWLPGRVAELKNDHIFPLLERAYPEPRKQKPTIAAQRVPRALAKLRSGEPIRILAWGDSVTVGTYVPDPAKERWQEQFVARLQQRFPKAKIELITEAWGGRNTGSYLAEPPGSEHNYQEKVLATKPDLIVSEFVNDAGLNPAQVEERYSKLLADFQQIGAEWIILTPHYVRPDWMGLTRERDVDDDPRPYVAGLRQFSEKHNIALADASLRYGRLWRQGIPYSTLMLNSINHPDARGMKLFADALMQLFP